MYVAELVGAKVELLRVVELPHPVVVPPSRLSDVLLTPTVVVDGLARSGRTYVDSVARRESNAHPGVTIVTDLVVSETPAHTIVDIASKRSVDLIAMATHGCGVSRLVLPCVTDRVLRGGTTGGAVLLMRAGSD
jgi:nucleotide-binding universal stress UspA family protein